MSGTDVEGKQTGRSAAWNKGARDFAQEFKPIVATNGRNLFKYSDAAKCQESKLEPEKILKARSVVAGLHRMNSSLSFKSSLVKQGLQRIAKEIGPDNGLGEVHYKIWSDTYCRRIMNICRHVRCATSRPKPPKWASDLMDFVKGEIAVPVTVGTLEAEPGSNTFDEHTETTVAFDETSEFEQGSKQKCEDECESQLKYHYGWNKELSHAWRKPLDDMKASPELAISADELLGNTLGDKGAVLCKWADGHEYVLGCVCVGDLRAMTKGGRHGRRSVGEYFSKQHVVTKNTISVRRRSDRELLVSVFEHAQQIVQVAVKLFATESAAAEKAAADFLIETIAEPYALNAIEKCNIQTIRNAALQKLGKKFGFRGSKRDADEMQTTVPPVLPNKTQTKKAKLSASKPQHAKSDDQEEPPTNVLSSDAAMAHDHEVLTVEVPQRVEKTRFFAPIPIGLFG